MKYLIDKNNFKGNILTTIRENGCVDYSGYLYNNGGENLLLDEYIKLDHIKHLAVEVVNDEQLDALLKIYHDEMCGNWEEITEDKYWEMLECLPPMKWHNVSPRYNVFFCMEAMTSHIHSLYVKDDDGDFQGSAKYYTCLFFRFASDVEILKAIENIKK